MLIAMRSFAVLLMPTWNVRPADAEPSIRFCPLKFVVALMRVDFELSCVYSVWM